MARMIGKAGRGMRALWLQLLAFLAGLFGATSLASCPIVALYMPPPGAIVTGRTVRAGVNPIEHVKGIKASLYNGGDVAIKSRDVDNDGSFYLAAYGLDASKDIVLEFKDNDPNNDGNYKSMQIDLKAREDFDPDGFNELGDIGLTKIESSGE